MFTENHKSPFIPVLILWIAGFLCSRFIAFPDVVYYSCILLSMIVFLLLKSRRIVSLLLYLLLFLCSLWFNRHVDDAPVPKGVYSIKCRCEENLSGHNYIVSADGRKYFLSGDSCYRFIPGDSLNITGNIAPIKEVSNIYAFNYMRYLKQKGIFFRIYPRDSIIRTGQSENYYAILQRVRHYFLDKTDLLFKDPAINGVVKAVGLGYKNDVESEILHLFSTTGTIHLLAVSGLHVGIVYYLIVAILQFVGIRNKKMQLIVIPLLWGYACITGLSPSVCRAALILSFIIAGSALNREYSPINAIAASALCTLIANPFSLYSISMQMSYAAYTGIILFYPILRDLPGKMQPAVRKIYSLMSISIAAQILTIPLSIYHFHYFSINSFIINILVVPITGFLLYSYLFLLIVPIIIGDKLVFIVDWLCQFVFYALDLFQEVNIALKEVAISAVQVIQSYVSIILFAHFIRTRKRIILKLTLISIFVLFNATIIHNILIHNKKEIVVFHVRNNSCVLLNYNGFYTYLIPPAHEYDRKQTTPYIMRHKLHPLPPHNGFYNNHIRFDDRSLTTKEERIRIIRDKSEKIVCLDTNEIIIVTHNLLPPVTSDLNKPLPRRIILDSSNKPRNISAWRTFCEENCIKLDITSLSGSIIIPLNRD